MVHPYVVSEDGKYFDVSFNEGGVSFLIIDMEEHEIDEVFEDIKSMVRLLKEHYQSSNQKVKK